MPKKYWEAEKCILIEFGNSFMRSFDEAGKLQFGVKYNGNFIVKFVLDRKDLFSSDAAPGFLRGTIDDWEERIEGGHDDDD